MTRGQVRVQFLVEVLLLSAFGGAAGVLLGAAVTAGFALWKDWPPVVPGWALAATSRSGRVAGLYTAMRAVRLPPTAALGAA